MYTYTATQLEHKTFGELKAIAYDCQIVPVGDRRCRQTWIDVLVGIEFPLLQLLEASPVASVEQVQGSIESPPEALECPFCGVIHALFTTKDCLERPVIRCLHCLYSRIKDYPGAIQVHHRELIENSPGVEPILTGIALSDRFLACYSPPQPENVCYQADADGQLSLFDFEVESADEPSDFDDFESLDAFRDAIALWDSEHCEPLEVSLDSFCEWAPCPDDWYDPVEVLELPRAIESSITCNFFIPTFGAAGDRTNRSFDEPPTVGAGARLPKPKPPNFPSAVVALGDRSSIRKFARSAILLSGRSPPGGDVTV